MAVWTAAMTYAGSRSALADGTCYVQDSVNQNVVSGDVIGKSCSGFHLGHGITNVTVQAYPDACRIVGNTDPSADYMVLLNSPEEWHKFIDNPPPGVVIGSCTIDGACGTGNGTPVYEAPTKTRCDAGAASAIKSENGKWNWTCQGVEGGKLATCSAPDTRCDIGDLKITGNPDMVITDKWITVKGGEALGLSGGLSCDIMVTAGYVDAMLDSHGHDVTITGNTGMPGLSINGDNGHIAVSGSNDVVNVRGDKNSITVAGSISMTTVLGSQNKITGTGNYTTVNFSGDGNIVSAHGNLLTVSFHGDGNNLSTDGRIGEIDFSGDGNTVQEGDDEGAIDFSGNDNTLSATGNLSRIGCAGNGTDNHFKSAEAGNSTLLSCPGEVSTAPATPVKQPAIPAHKSPTADKP